MDDKLKIYWHPERKEWCTEKELIVYVDLPYEPPPVDWKKREESFLRDYINNAGINEELLGKAYKEANEDEGQLECINDWGL